MPTERINPAAMGGEPAAYSNAIAVTAPQKTVYVAGQIGIDAKGVASADFAEQTRQAWANVRAILEEAGLGLADIVKTTIYLVDPSTYATFAEIRKETLAGHKPASTLVYVSGLVKPDWKVEIDVVAAR